jgi:hypothetical protein
VSTEFVASWILTPDSFFLTAYRLLLTH